MSVRSAKIMTDPATGLSRGKSSVGFFLVKPPSCRQTGRQGFVVDRKLGS